MIQSQSAIPNRNRDCASVVDRLTAPSTWLPIIRHPIVTPSAADAIPGATLSRLATGVATNAKRPAVIIPMAVEMSFSSDMAPHVTATSIRLVKAACHFGWLAAVLRHFAHWQANPPSCPTFPLSAQYFRRSPRQLRIIRQSPPSRGRYGQSPWPRMLRMRYTRKREASPAPRSAARFASRSARFSAPPRWPGNC